MVVPCMIGSERDVLLQNVKCPRENLRAYVLILSEFEIQFPSFPFTVQSMSLNRDMKIRRSPNSSGSIFSLCKSTWISGESAMT